MAPNFGFRTRHTSGENLCFDARVLPKYAALQCSLFGRLALKYESLQGYSSVGHYIFFGEKF